MARADNGEWPRLSLMRKFMLWYLDSPPYSPYVSLSFSMDYQPAGRYLEQLNQRLGPHITLNHLFTAAVGRVYAEFPEANATVMGKRIRRHAHVGAAMPVDTSRGANGRRDELGAILVERVEELSLRQLTERVRRQVSVETSSGAPQHWLFRRLAPFADGIPSGVLHHGLDAVDALLRIPPVAQRVHRLFPLTVLVSNVGSQLHMPAGAVGRGLAFSFPTRLFALGSAFGIFPLQDEVVPVDGEPQVRRMLPVGFVFDHRLFDGVMAGRILSRLADVLATPEEVFGARGERPGPPMKAG